MKKTKNSKVFVIGLDGATFDLLRPWIDQGRLPTFKKLIEGGIYGDLISTIPPVTSPAWPSFMTGKNPGKHGVFDFVGGGLGYEKEIKNAKDIKSKTLWELLSEEGKVCIIINVPVTYPLRKINGCIVSGMLTPLDVCYTHPPEIAEELNKLGYIIEPEIKETFSETKILEVLLDASSKRFKAALHLMKKLEWNFFMIVFRGTDVIQHHLWQFGKETILDYYKHIDVLLEKLIEKTGENVNIILMSDHGFGPIYKTFHVNTFLKKIGLLRVKQKATEGDYIRIKDYRSSRKSLKGLFLRLGVTKERIFKIAKKLNLIKVLQWAYKIVHIKFPTTTKSIDWKNTKAFFSSSIGPTSSIRINLKGREPMGIVKNEEYEKIKNFIIDQLLKIRDSESEEKIVQKVLRREEIYYGPNVEEAPDIVILTRDLKYGSTDRIYGDAITSEPIHKGRGTHRMNGIFLAYGPDIKKTGELLQKLNIIDIAPTILHMFKIPIPKDIDGGVLKEIFESSSEFSKRKVKYQKIEEGERIKSKIRKLKKL